MGFQVVANSFIINDRSLICSSDNNSMSRSLDEKGAEGFMS